MTPATVVDPTATTAFFCGGGPLAAAGRTESVQRDHGADQGSSEQRRRARSELLHRLGCRPDCFESGGDPDEHAAAYHRRPGGNALISTGVEVADTTFAVPGASGCGLLGALDPALDLKVGLPSPSGKNSALIDQNGEVEAAQFLLPPTPTPTPTRDRHSDCDRYPTVTTRRRRRERQRPQRRQQRPRRADGYAHRDLHGECDLRRRLDCDADRDANPRKVDRQPADACIPAAGSRGGFRREKCNSDQFELVLQFQSTPSRRLVITASRAMDAAALPSRPAQNALSALYLLRPRPVPGREP